MEKCNGCEYYDDEIPCDDKTVFCRKTLQEHDSVVALKVINEYAREIRRYFEANKKVADLYPENGDNFWLRLACLRLDQDQVKDIERTLRRRYEIKDEN